MFCAVAGMVHATEFSPEKFLEALAMKETGQGWDGKPGPCGELSRWQITSTVWAEEMPGVPFSEAYNDERARECALKHLARLRKQIIAAGHRPTPERLATCWHYGASHRWVASRWGQEVENVYHVL